ncbi:hypothetical protein GGI20_002201 [Coemansia sp. BCRC 34301]|nr:hypothetical protein GGI20_002201 [Coemansia sp. BCRC 34301]
MLNGRQTFGNKHNALRQVILHENIGSEDIHLLSKAEVGKLISTIASSAQRLALSTSLLVRLLISTAQHKCGFESIQLFETRSNELYLSDLLHLLKGLPALVKLRSGINGLGPELVNIAADELPEYVLTMYGNTGSILPFPIVNLIRVYLEKGAVTVFAEPTDTKINIKVMLYVCSSWRQTTLVHIWRDLNIVIDAEKGSVGISGMPWKSISKLPQGIAGLVRSLYICLDITGITNGAARKLLAEFMGDTVELSCAHKVSITIGGWMTKSPYTGNDAVSNALEFAQLVQTLTKDATALSVKCDGLIIGVEKHDEEALVALTKWPHIKSLALDLGIFGIKHSLTINQFPQLSALHINCKELYGLSTSLVHRNAASLVDLYVGVVKARSLVYDVGGNGVVYPNLKQLNMIFSTIERTYEQVAAPGIVPFPALTCLRVGMPYPFSDDVMFRGNNTTLEYLSLIISGSTVNVLNDSRVFGNKHGCLRSVKIDEDFRLIDLALVPEATLNKVLCNMIGSAHKLTVSFTMAGKYLTAAAPVNGFQSVRVLWAGIINFSLYEILSLLKAFPALAALRCHVNGVGAELEHAAAENLPDYVATTYSKAGGNLQAWSIPGYHGITHSSVAEFVMLIALACPQLTRVNLGPGDGAVFADKVSEALATEPYSKYALQLNRLFRAVHY